MSDGSAQHSARRSTWYRIFVVCGVVFGLGAWFIWSWPTRQLHHAEVAAREGKHDQAEEIVRRVLEWRPDWPPAVLVAADAAVVQKEYARAVDYWDRIPNDGSQLSRTCRELAAALTLKYMHRLTDAERRLRKILDRRPYDVQAQRSLVFLLDVCGRGWEAMPTRLELIRQGDRKLRDLRMLIDRDSPTTNVDFVKQCLQSSPDDPLTKLAVAAAQLRAGQNEQAESLLHDVMTTDPDVVEAQVRLGRLLWEKGDADRFQAWLANLPESAKRHPETWALRGDLARQEADLCGAARCYWESLRRDACYQRSAYQLGQILIALGESERAAPFVERAARLQQLAAIVNQHTATPSAAAMKEIVVLCESLGLLWEERAWAQLALDTNPQLIWAHRHLERTGPLVGPDILRTVSDADPALTIDLSDFPMPAWNAAVVAFDSTTKAPDGNIRFIDEADAAHLDFRYFNDDNPNTPAARPFEFTGGGVAVLDYDGDGWPDVFLTQGAVWPYDTNQQTHLDRLFRNLGDGTFRDVTTDAGLIEDRYSQGATVGDYNDDGCPDLYVANLDANRMYRNNGDGTFTDVTVETGTGGDRWTTSCLMADLNGDAWPDIYAVNYLAGSDVFERICRSADGEPRICTPNDFEPAQDQLYLNLGNGRFEEWTQEAGLVTPHGKGLGVVGFTPAEAQLLDLFVANDTDGNGYFINQTPRSGEPPVFGEEATGSGLAFDQDGVPQACMGVAVGDADGDGLIDLFVTNFYQEANTLYLQQPGNLFHDATLESGLREASLLMLGFGTQFLDAELDGFPDLIAVNGHVEDQRDRGIPYQMRPQFFHNLGPGRFTERSAESLGPYFEKEALGRGLARIDWNRDGREDAVVSHLDVPAALLTNRTSTNGHFVALQLHGTTSSRDAIGTTVTVTGGDRIWVQQLTAGDGYQASNQRQLIFGLGPREEVDAMTVRWPTGLEQRFLSVPIDAELIAVEGRASLFRAAAH